LASSTSPVAGLKANWRGNAPAAIVPSSACGHEHVVPVPVEQQADRLRADPDVGHQCHVDHLEQLVIVLPWAGALAGHIEQPPVR
jgi:hypothetical protein